MRIDRGATFEATVYLGEKINIASSARLKDILQSLCNESYKLVTIDFSQVKVIDSTCLGTLLLFQKKLGENGGELIITNVTSDYIKKMFTLIQLPRVIDIR